LLAKAVPKSSIMQASTITDVMNSRQGSHPDRFKKDEWKT
jgi:hypothetical protein